MSRQIAVKLTHETHGTVSVPTLVRTLDALQKVLLQVGEMCHALATQADDRARRSRGQFNGTIRSACELQIVRLEIGSAEAVLELPPPGLTLFPHVEDLGVQALGTTRRLVGELASRAPWERTRDTLPLDAYRNQILDTCRKFCPTPSEHIELSIWDPESPQNVDRVRPESRVHIQELKSQASPDEVLEERRFVGRIDPLYRLVLSDGGGMSIPFDAEVAGEYLPAPDELFIASVICRVARHRDEDDMIVEIRDVVEIVPFDASPLDVRAIIVDSGELQLRAPLRVPLQVFENMVLFEYAPLGIFACGATRDEADGAFRDELSWLWAEYADAEDSALAEDTQALKTRLHMLVEGER